MATARRAPRQGDLRLVIAVAKTITDLERVGDEAQKIGRMAAQLATYDRPKSAFRQIESLGRYVREMSHDALDAFARLDSEPAIRMAQRPTTTSTASTRVLCVRASPI